MHQDITLLLQHICTLHDNVGEFVNRYQSQALPNSRADMELHSYSRPESLITAYCQGGVLVEVAADQLMALTKTLTEPAQAMAPWTCVRAMLESCALASWLLSPNIDAKTRVQRSLAFRYEGLSQQLKFAIVASGDKTVITRITTRIDDVEHVALNLGFPKVLNKKNKRIGIGQEMPFITTLVQSELDEESLYRLLSAVIHAHPWALQQLSFRRINNDNYQFVDGSDNDVKIHVLEKNLEFTSVAFLCHEAVINFIKPVWYQCQLLGWDQEDMKSFFESTFNSLGLQDEKRFWRNSDIKSG